MGFGTADLIDDLRADATEAQRESARLQAKMNGLRALIADDAWAMSFQTMGQYRTALLQHINAPSIAIDREADR